MQITDLQNLVTAIRRVYPDAVISGGAPRDILHGKPVKDIDVMTGYDVGRSGLEKIAMIVGGKLDVIEPKDPSGVEEFEYEIHFADGRPRLNIIDLNPFEITDPLENLLDFDFGLSQVAVLPTGLIHTPAFIRDATRGTITYMGDNGKEYWRINSSAKRLQRLKAKYGGWTFLNCAGLEARVV
ncbi:hypothetical protein [Burkholderia ubonensis]|uniref:hypothetical protein n=1 Tax=Burkholderia ubonensis TaxID=101571 RepID=UPI000754BD14|nr:hypothetical protein [Burkholderia ubonensis]KVL67375.1 hypothetical protein WJ48_14070 [Burkholderia ubonensis]KVL71428.1 hypothetical protein WJ49_20395 [Burkholderia ubonensis]KVL91317.1 hypothetical protein WJ50_11380 [Burkholderia ubonensis]KWK75573.1 hypothetical protein WM15_30475 [Burkholderia ubonensis]